MKLNNRGFSFVQVMIVAGIIAGLSLVLMQLTKQSSKSSAKYQFDTDVTQITNEVNAILSDPAKCIATLNPTGTANVSTPTSINGKFSTTGTGFGNANVEITSYAYSANPFPSNDGQLVINYKNKNILKGSSGPEAITKKVNLYVEQNASNLLLRCRSLSTSSTDIWTRGTDTNIYYDGGNVGIGVTAPGAKLEIAGGIKPGSATTNTTCSPNPEGTFAYDTASHAPVYCNNAGIWTTMGGGGVSDITGANPVCPSDKLTAGHLWVARNCDNIVSNQTTTCVTAAGWSKTVPSCVVHWSGDNNDGNTTCPATTWTQVKCI